MKNRIFIAAFALLLAAAVCAVFIIKRAEPESSAEKYAEIISGGKVIETVDLSKDAAPRDITVTAPDGGMNTVHTEDGSVSVTDADCPDKLCVKQGRIINDIYPIICLPHKLTVRIVTVSDSSEIDAIVGR